jgi:hypothetical protein
MPWTSTIQKSGERVAKGIDDGRPEPEFIVAGDREVEYFLTEEEVTHTPEKRDAASETGRWGLARR